jgi:alpha-beta hydrolase superfamily lysophospholipase
MYKKALTLALYAAVLASQIIPCAPVQAQTLRDDDAKIVQLCQVPAYVWSDDEVTPKGMVILVHGFTQQGKSVEVLAKALAHMGYLVISPDQRGHGRWHYKDQSTGSFGGDMVDYKASINDIEKLIKAAKDLHPELSLFCLGESAGAAIVAEAASRQPENVSGVILCSAGRYPRIYNVFWVVKDFLCNVYRLNHPINLRPYIKQYASDDPRIVDEMVNEPLDRNELSGRELLRTVAFIRRTTKHALKHLPSDVPLLVMQGKLDHIVQSRTVAPMVRKAKARDKNYVVFPDCGHVLVGTSYIRPVVSETIENWIDKRTRVTNLSASSRMLTPAAGTVTGIDTITGKD